MLRKHSILDRLMPELAKSKPEPDVSTFELGLATAKKSGADDFTHQIFATRTLGLTKRLAPASLADYLSGLLIGHELMSGLKDARNNNQQLLIGDPALCDRCA